MVVLIIRWTLTVALLYGIYTETGPWTTLALGLVFLCSELPQLGAWMVTKYSNLDTKGRA